MSRIGLSDFLSFAQGKHGDIVIKKINGRYFTSRRAVPEKPPTENQKAWRRRFKMASDFAQAVKDNPDLLAFYAPLAKVERRRMREIVLRDAFEGPRIESIDLSRYDGQPGGVVRVGATDNIGVSEVIVSLDAGNGNAELGSAVPNGNTWLYTATRAMPFDQPIRVQVTARDRPHNCVTEARTWTRVAK